MKAIVFGATGFIGSHVVHELAHARHRVTAVVRAGSDTAFLRSLKVRICELDFDDVRALPRAIEGHEVVYNCIMETRANKPIATYRLVNAYMTRWIAEAAARVDVARFVQLSNVLVYGSRLPDSGIAESFPCAPQHPLELASADRERVIQEVVEATDLPTVILRAVPAIGARDATYLQRIRTHAAGRLRYVGDGDRLVSYIDARDLGRALVFLGEAPRLKHDVYIAQGFDASVLQEKEVLDRLNGHVATAERIAPSVAAMLGQVLEWVTPETREPLFTRATAAWAAANRRFDGNRLRKAGFVPRYGLGDSIAAVFAASLTNAAPAAPAHDAHAISDKAITN